jgi:hypothetical protein
MDFIKIEIPLALRALSPLQGEINGCSATKTAKGKE